MSDGGLPFQNAWPVASTEDDRIELRSLFLLIWRRKSAILAVSLAGMIVAFALVSQVTPRYSAAARVMLDPRTVQVLDSDDVVSNLTLSTAVLDTESAMLRSTSLLERVIAGMEPAALTRFDPANQSPGLIDEAKDAVAGALSALMAAVGLDRAAAGAPARPQLDPETERLRRLTGELKRNLRVWREGESYMITVAVTTQDPALSAAFANGITEAYIAGQIEQRGATVRGATDFLTGRVAEMRGALEEAEAAIETFRSGQLAESGVSLETLEQQLLDLNSQLALARADLASAQSRYDRIASVISTDGIEVAAELLSSPLVISLREDLLELRREDADLATALGPEHPDRQRLRASIGLVSDDLAAEVRKIVATLRNDAEVAEIRVQSLRDSLGEIETRLIEMSRDTLALRQLEREAEAVRTNYAAVLDRLNETRSVEELQRADARIVERAYPPIQPSEPRLMLFTALGGSVGFMAGLVLVFVLAMSTVGFRGSGQIEQATGLPVVASLPRRRWRTVKGMLRALHADPYQAFAERLRALRTTLKLHAEGRAIRTIAVTSAVPTEGKTTTAAALACIEAMAGRRCIVLDLDTRRSVLAREFRYAPPGGDLADVLAGHAPLQDAISPVPGENFDLLTVRAPAPQLLEQVGLARLKSVLAVLRDSYDTVIIDTPPVFLVADALAIATVADTVLMAVKESSTRRRAVTESAQQLVEVGARSVALVMTMVDPQEQKDTYGISTDVSYAPR
ncbi:Tyrosine-protein kinase ptk [Roseivivax jejudonensis]|uniref:non-specific protein-tyrosine kinase n=1 Tax=Roseivivax jejudonensis TaxID=1529041 RepID=A0A1X6ZK51_9RHOB|nr:polysaccharide biosynthesis tyrosine autokinase [Roseivivax jejudonensis]SLN53357.1 Tyrosine-protein kinase ptk [Roseivivax jejudonensis]